VNMTAFVGIPAFGQGFVVFAWTLWWIDAFISLLVGIGVPFAIFNYHNQSLEAVTGAWLLPVVSPIVSAATGGIVAQYLPPAHARLTLVCSYIIWGCGFPIAVLVMAIYFQRLAMHHLPPRATIVSVFLPLGPCGQGSFALLQFAKVVHKLADETGVGLGNGSSFDRQSQLSMALAVYAVSLPVALVIWGMGLFWLVIAVGSIIKGIHVSAWSVHSIHCSFGGLPRFHCLQDLGDDPFADRNSLVDGPHQSDCCACVARSSIHLSLSRIHRKESQVSGGGRAMCLSGKEH